MEASGLRRLRTQTGQHSTEHALLPIKSALKRLSKASEKKLKVCLRRSCHVQVCVREKETRVDLETQLQISCRGVCISYYPALS